MHNPGFLGLFINPFYFARKGLYKNVKDIADKVKGKTLDVGCGSKPYEHLYGSTEYIGLEFDTPENREFKNADFFYDGNTFPFTEASFNSVVANEVFEHVFNPDNFLDEIHRILSKDGVLLMTMPFAWDEHEQPYDFARYSSFGIKHLLENHNFEIIHQKKSVDDITVIFQLLSLYIFKKLITKNSLLNVFIIFILISPINIIGSIVNLFLPKNEDLYLDNIILAKKI
jgi:SAM-dependent methyltransferase